MTPAVIAAAFAPRVPVRLVMRDGTEVHADVVRCLDGSTVEVQPWGHDGQIVRLPLAELVSASVAELGWSEYRRVRRAQRARFLAGKAIAL